MRHLILSDIHSNLEALHAVLRHAEGAYDTIVCCGDLVGYNAAPIEVIDWARQTLSAVVRGNHDTVCCGVEDPLMFNSVARQAALWTLDELPPASRAWLADLPAGPLTFDSFEIAHGSPGGEDDYLIDTIDIHGLDQIMMRKICFFGHTHLQGGWSWQRGGIQRLTKPALGEDERIIDLDPDFLYLINPGSVGQPRDGDPRAAYAIWDAGNALLRFRRVKYDIRSAQNRIHEAGLPEYLADRLAAGR
ncbi:MAG: metallophosphoesterase family protein [Paludibaculum sp.]